MIRAVAILFAVVFLALGALGFVPPAAGTGTLLKIFQVNSAHNLVNLASGIVFLLCGTASARAAQICLRVLGFVYAVVAVFGFLQGDGLILGYISNNNADTWLHVALATAMLTLGWIAPLNGTKS